MRWSVKFRPTCPLVFSSNSGAEAFDTATESPLQRGYPSSKFEWNKQPSLKDYTYDFHDQGIILDRDTRLPEQASFSRLSRLLLHCWYARANEIVESNVIVNWYTITEHLVTKVLETCEIKFTSYCSFRQNTTKETFWKARAAMAFKQNERHDSLKITAKLLSCK